MSHFAYFRHLLPFSVFSGQYKKYLAQIALPQRPIDFQLLDVGRLQKPAYDTALRQEVLAARQIQLDDLLKPDSLTASGAAAGAGGTGLEDVGAGDDQLHADTDHHQPALRVVFQDPREFRRLADRFGLMSDVRSGLLRTAYHGIVSFTAQNRRIYALHPRLDLTKELGQQQPDRDIYSEDWDKMSRYLDFALLLCKPTK